jgi:hypothetical protein
MLRIRDAHLAAFDHAARAELATILAARMKDAWPAECAQLGDARLLDRCRLCIDDARALGLRTDRAIARLLNLRFLYNDRFPDPRRDAEFITILRAADLPEQQKLDYIWARVRSSVGAAAV